MSHIHTLPEEVEIVLSELNASEINLENRSLKSVQIRSQEGWHANTFLRTGRPIWVEKLI